MAFPGCQMLDVAGPFEVFHGATVRLGAPPAARGYALTIAAPTKEPIRTESGLVLVPEVSLATLLARGDRFDTVIVAGGIGVERAVRDPEFLGQLRGLAAVSIRVGSVCTGAFLLAAAGLLDGRSATTHWAWCEMMTSSFPAVTVVPGRVFVRDGSIWSSAGVSAGMDLALAMVADDFGKAVATDVAKLLVVYMRRAGSQAQLSEPLQIDAAEPKRVRDLATWIDANPRDDLSVPTLARRVGMSVRNFARVFRSEVGRSPARYVADVRREHALRMVETSQRGMAEIAAACGFGSVSALRRVLRSR